MFILLREAPQLVAALREMKEGLDKVTAKVQDLTAKVGRVLDLATE